jgi:GNAT superfamily N-acetyltransferase
MMAPVRKVIIRRAVPGDASGIARVCAEGWRDTYEDIYPSEEIERVIADYYAPERITSEIIAPEGWDGWFVAIECGKVVGAGGGGMTDPSVGEIFVLYLDPTRRGEGIGSLCSTRSPSSSVRKAHASSGSASSPKM